MIQSRKQFDVLTFINRTQGTKFTQRAMSSQMNISLGTINQILNELLALDFIFQDGLSYHVSAKGYQALLPYRVKRAIILADGFDQRLLPLTAKMPFALATLHGHRMIETILDALQKANIEEIYIVKGYLGEQFNILEAKYPKITFIQNPYDLQTKSIMSLYMAKEYLAQAYILDGSICLYDPTILNSYEYTSCIGGVQADWCDGECFHARKGIIQRMEQGGRNCHLKVGISYVSAQDALKLQEDMECAMRLPGGKQKDYVELFFQSHVQRYQLALKHIPAQSMIKVTSFQELKQIDITYDVVD